MLTVKSCKLMRYVQPLLSRFAIIPGYIAQFSTIHNINI